MNSFYTLNILFLSKKQKLQKQIGEKRTSFPVFPPIVRIHFSSVGSYFKKHMNFWMVEEFRIVCLTSPSLIFPQKFGDLNKISILGFVHEWDMATQMTRYFDEFIKWKLHSFMFMTFMTRWFDELLKRKFQVTFWNLNLYFFTRMVLLATLHSPS